jgi:hypothetical protein
VRIRTIDLAEAGRKWKLLAGANELGPVTFRGQRFVPFVVSRIRCVSEPKDFETRLKEQKPISKPGPMEFILKVRQREKSWSGLESNSRGCLWQ